MSNSDQEIHDAARDAIDRGRTALTAGDRPTAIQWLGRAHRLLPQESSATLLLASAMSATNPRGALTLIDSLTSSTPRRDVHISRVALFVRCGDFESAAAALDHLLSNFAASGNPAFNALATQVANRTGHAGWIGVTGKGIAICHAASFTLALDSAPFLKSNTPGDHPLPSAWRIASLLNATAPGRLLGTAINLAAICQLEGFVAYDSKRGLHGWAVAPFDPDTIPLIDVFAGAARKPFTSLPADNASLILEHGEAAPYARGFHLEQAALPSATSFRIRTRQGADLAGSPIIHPEKVTKQRRQPAPKRQTPPRREIDVVIPLYRGLAYTEACVASLRDDFPPNTRIVAIDDGIPEPALRAWAQHAAANNEIVLLRHARNRGFPAAVNTLLRHAGGRDVVILNSDTLLPPGALSRLANAAYAAPDIGTATPMTNDGSITNLSTPGHAEPMPDASSLRVADAELQAANPGLYLDIPTCAGFCTYIRHDCIAGTGLMREDAFAQGYGEEIDFSRRAVLLGWRHVAVCDLMVGHEGGISFGAARASLMARNLETVERLHPGYLALMADFAACDPLRSARTGYDARRWAAGRREGAIVLVTHHSGGGVERYVAARVGAIRALRLRAIVLRPRNGFAISDGMEDTHPNLLFDNIEEMAAFLRLDRPRAVELHHIAAHQAGIERLAAELTVPFDVVVHDYAAICPRVTLCADEQYCGEPMDVRVCDNCIAEHGARIPFSGTVAGLRASQAALFRAAECVVVATQDAAYRLKRHLGEIKLTVRPWEDDTLLPAVVASAARGPVHAAVVGGIGVEKGFFTLLECAKNAALRNLPLRFTVVGPTIDDKRLMETGRIFVTGPYVEGEAVALLHDAAPDIGFLPSIWPETWCYALSALWEAGLHVVAFDLGAPAERIRVRGAGTLLPPGMSAGAINDRILELAAPRRNKASG